MRAVIVAFAVATEATISGIAEKPSGALMAKFSSGPVLTRLIADPFDGAQAVAIALALGARREEPEIG